ncbi:MAG: PQQ-binding-like beta-propeller repeat protein, partial [Halanaerobacter sp.]
GTIYLAGIKLHAIDPCGIKKWSLDIGGGNTNTASPIIGNNKRIYLRNDKDSYLYAITTTGEKVWQYKLDEGSFWGSTVVGRKGRIYIGSSKLHAIDAQGQKRWTYSPDDWVTSNIVIGGELIYFGAGEKLYALDQSGNLVWVFKAEGDILSSPALTKDNLIYLPSDKLYVLNQNGEKKRILKTNEFLSDLVVDQEGTIYFGSGNKLYAINDQNGGLAASPWPMIYNNLRHTGCQL